MNFKSFKDMHKDIPHFISTLPKDFDLIIGIPRSGLLVANIIAMYINLPFTDLEGFLNGRIFEVGETRFKNYHKGLLQGLKKILVIDDSVRSGKSINGAMEKLEMFKHDHEIKYGTLYITPENRGKVDYAYEVLSEPRLFEWNLFSHNYLNRCCVDIDGVLCRDPDREEDDDGLAYENFILNVSLNIMPTAKIGWLISCRLNKYRKITEKWLSKHNIQYDHLILMDHDSKEERMKQGLHSQFKSKHYKKTNARLFIESSMEQAVEIAKLSGKEVLCFESLTMVKPSYVSRGLNTPNNLLYRVLRISRKILK